MKIKRNSTILFPYKYFTEGELPTDICEFRTKWFLGILNIILSPFVFIYSIFTKKYFGFWNNIFINLILIFLEIAGTVIFDGIIYKSNDLLSHPFWTWIVGVITIILILIIVFFMVFLITEIEFYFENKKTKKEDSCVICKMYKSWYNKFCEKIEII